MKAHAWTKQAGTHGPLTVGARAFIGGPVEAGVQITGDLQNGGKAVVLELDVPAAMQLRAELDAAIRRAPAKARRQPAPA